MLDIKYIKENLEQVKKALAKRGSNIDPVKKGFSNGVNLEKIIKLDDEKKDIQGRVETLRAESNVIAKEKKKSDRAVEIKKMLKDLEAQLADITEKYKIEAVNVPNIVLGDVPEGNAENNEIVKKVGKINIEKGKNHIELGTSLDLIDIDRASKVSGPRFYFLKNQAVELEFALVKYALDIVKKAGFAPIIPPILIKEDMAWGSGHFEAVNDDTYHMKNDELVAVGTSEQSILPMHSSEVLENLPKRYVGFSTCLRREAGSYGKDVKGILRAHQFDKLEMFTYCAPEDSEKEHELIVSLQEKIMAGLDLPYQVAKLAAGDLGLPSAKTIDIETWMPGQSVYRETHSSSNCTDFQARRLNIKYKNGEKSAYVHTLNGTAVAIGRTLIAILENYQQEDGSVKVPEVLHKYLDFKEIYPVK